ncbi:MAG: CDF family Co(II)/Ni(II) efflux transporter DmeF [Methylovirgula sp.]
MHSHSFDLFQHDHNFLGADHARNERRSWMVIALCTAMMAAEIVGGLMFGSMALIADGLHMSTHAGAFLIAALAYGFARRHCGDERFAFGTGKFGDLAAFTSAIILAFVALLIGWESISRLFQPVTIAFNQAIPIAAVGLAVNIASAFLLRDDHDHHHSHHDDHDHVHVHDHVHAHHHGAHHTDLNLRAAYVHVLADAAVSVLAIIGLVAGRQWGLVWMDPVMGLIGAAVIASWSVGLLRSAGAILLDLRPDSALADEIRARLQADSDDLVSDLHLWRVGPGHAAVVASLVSSAPQPPTVYKARLAHLHGLSHVTIEVLPCPGH